MGPDAMIFSFWMLSFKPTFSLSTFTFIKRLFSSSSLSAIRVVSSAYLRLQILLPAILILVCDSSSPVFLMMYSAYKLNKQGDNTQPWRTPFPILNQSVVPCPVPTVASWPAHRFFRWQVKWSHTPISLRIFQFVIHRVKGFSIVNLYWLWNSLAFSTIQQVLAIWFLVLYLFKTSLYIWNLSVHRLQEPSLKDFEHNIASIWNEGNCMVVWVFFGIVLLWDWNETHLFQSCGHCWVFQIWLHIECTTVTASSFRVLDISAGIPSCPLALFRVVLPNAHLTSQSRMSGSRWVTTPSWLSRSLRPFLYSSSVYYCQFFLISSASVINRSYCFCPLSCPSLHEMFLWCL